MLLELEFTTSSGDLMPEKALTSITAYRYFASQAK